MARFIYYGLLIFGTGFILILPPFSALATEQEARLFVQTISDRTLDTIRDLKLTDAEKEKKLTGIFVAAVDTKWIGKFVMGKTWRTLSSAQQQHYSELFDHFLIGQYVPKFKLYNNNYYQILKVIPEENNRYTIYTLVTNPDGVSLSVNYKLHSIPDMGYKIYDVVAEGISLLNTQRSEFSSILTREGPDALIVMLEHKVQISTH